MGKGDSGSGKSGGFRLGGRSNGAAKTATGGWHVSRSTGSDTAAGGCSHTHESGSGWHIGRGGARNRG